MRFTASSGKLPIGTSFCPLARHSASKLGSGSALTYPQATWCKSEGEMLYVIASGTSGLLPASCCLKVILSMHVTPQVERALRDAVPGDFVCIPKTTRLFSYLFVRGEEDSGMHITYATDGGKRHTLQEAYLVSSCIVCSKRSRQPARVSLQHNM